MKDYMVGVQRERLHKKHATAKQSPAGRPDGRASLPPRRRCQ